MQNGATDFAPRSVFYILGFACTPMISAANPELSYENYATISSYAGVAKW